MEKQVSGCGNRMARSSANFPKRMQFRWPRRPEQFIPCRGSKAHHAGELPLEVSELNRPQQSSKIATERAYGRSVVGPLFHRDDQKDRGTSKRSGDPLRNPSRPAGVFTHADQIGCHFGLFFAARSRQDFPVRQTACEHANRSRNKHSKASPISATATWWACSLPSHAGEAQKISDATQPAKETE